MREHFPVNSLDSVKAQREAPQSGRTSVREPRGSECLDTPRLLVLLERQGLATRTGCTTNRNPSRFAGIERLAGCQSAFSPRQKVRELDTISGRSRHLTNSCSASGTRRAIMIVELSVPPSLADTLDVSTLADSEAKAAYPSL